MAREELSTIVQPIATMIQMEAAVASQRIVQQQTNLTERPTPRNGLKPLSELHRCGDALVAASESLLNRVQRDDASPYSAPVSRIHYLASTLRERLIELSPNMSVASDVAVECRTTLVNSLHAGRATASESSEKQCEWSTMPRQHCFSEDSEAVACRTATHVALTEVAAECDITESRVERSQPACSSTIRPPRVLVIDDSPFFRMLLETAVESAGHATLTLPSLDEAEAALNESQASDIVIWGGTDSSALTDCLTEWLLRRDDLRRPLLIGLAHGMEQSGEMAPEFDHVVLRTRLPDLLSIIRNKLGDATHAIKNSA
jgi:CheY-like chemotaxis protein